MGSLFIHFFDWGRSFAWMLSYTVAVKVDAEEGAKEGDGDSCYAFRRNSIEYIRNGVPLKEFRYWQRA